MGYLQATAVTSARQTINTGTFRLPSVGAIEHKLPVVFNSPTIAKGRKPCLGPRKRTTRKKGRTVRDQ